MPVTSFGHSSAALPGPTAAQAAAAPAPPPAPAAGGAVGHGMTRLQARSTAYATNPRFVPGAPPPKKESAGAHGDHKGRISIR